MIGTCYILGRAPHTKETLLDFHEWCRVTRHPRILCGLTGCQRDTPVLGRHRDLATYHALYIALWIMGAGMIITTPPMVGMMDFRDPYIQWYCHITRRFIIPPLHRDDMRFHTIAGTTQVLVS